MQKIWKTSDKDFILTISAIYSFTMLYVFLVDTGTMLTFEMELAMESVESLMKSIASKFLIPMEKQVLIMQGGEALDPNHRICNYSSAGTEHNPIFLFSKTTIESIMPPSPSLNLGSEASLKEEVEMSLKLPPTYETLVSRATLAMRFQDMGSELLQSCVSLIKEQRLQRQGWLAVVANLENIASAFETRGAILEQNYKEFLEIIPRYKSLLESFQGIIEALSKLPVFPCLIKDDMKSILPKDKRPTLFDWINAQDEKNSLEDMVRQCMDALGQFQNSSLLEILEDREQVLGDVSNKNIKEVGGLEERLTVLARLCEKARTLVQGQSDMAQGFSQNQVRAQNIGDASVLPDLCSSHQAQLSLMMHNHSQLRDIRRRCAKAKDELSGNLHARLRWIMMIEKKLCDCDNKLVMYHESMKRMRKRMEILEQINVAPRVYALTVKEVVRRREFSSQFAKWAKEISQHSDGVYKEEVASCHDYSLYVGNHFVKNLFTGIENMPTQFATVPEEFDADLPPLSRNELHELMKCAPNLFEKHPQKTHDSHDKPNTDSRTSAVEKSFSCSDLPSFKEFVVKTLLDGRDSKVTITKNEAFIQDQTTDSVTDESNESTEGDKNDYVDDVKLKTCDDIDGNESTEIRVTTKSKEHEIISSNITVKETLLMSADKLRKELEQLSLTTSAWNDDMRKYLKERWLMFEKIRLNERRRLLEAKSDNENVKQLTTKLDTLDKKIARLTSENGSLRKEIEARDTSFSEKELRYRNEVGRQKQYVSELESAKEAFESEQQIRFNSAIGRVMKEKEVACRKYEEQLSHFKLLREKSDEKLQVLFNEKEKLRQEKNEYGRKLAEAQEELKKKQLELERHIMETQKHLKERETEFSDQLEKERNEAETRLEAEKQKWETDSSVSGSGQIISGLVKERFHKRIKHLEEENNLLKDRMKSGSDGDNKLLFVELQQALEEKTTECDSLRAELELLQQKPRSSKDLQKGDVVKVYYNDQYSSYMIRAEGETLYFVHPDSLINLPDKSRPTFQAQVTEKEYCQAKKPNNRFKVQVGTKFYRVKIRSLDPSS